MADNSLTIDRNRFLALVLKSPTQMGWLSIINSVTNISRLGTFKVVKTLNFIGLPDEIWRKCSFTEDEIFVKRDENYFVQTLSFTPPLPASFWPMVPFSSRPSLKYSSKKILQAACKKGLSMNAII
jgi:hypothetical protein